MKSHQIFKGGWNAQRPDVRDCKFKLNKPVKLSSVYLAATHKMPPIYNQLALGSCVGNSVAKLVHFSLLNHYEQTHVGPWRPSRLFIYYYARLLEGTADQDSGCVIRDAIKVVASQGVPSEDAWIYDINKFAVQPSAYAIKLATSFEAIEYKTIDNTDKQLLVGALQQGFPISFGITVYDSFMTDQVAVTGIVPMPKSSEGVQGGHAMVIVGYRTEDDTFIFANSWGTDWGQGGYGRIPAAYITNPDLASDFWIISKIK